VAGHAPGRLADGRGPARPGRRARRPAGRRAAGEQIDRDALAELESSLLADAAAISHRDAAGAERLILVTLEAGWGVVPPSPLGRAFRDVLGRVNQALAREAAGVYLLVAGLPVDVKRLSRETLSRIDAGEPSAGSGETERER